jgi:hypothetical protein
MFDHTILYPASKQHSISISPSQITASAANACGFLLTPYIETAPHVQTAKPWPSCAGRFRCRLAVMQAQQVGERTDHRSHFDDP